MLPHNVGGKSLRVEDVNMGHIVQIVQVTIVTQPSPSSRPCDVPISLCHPTPRASHRVHSAISPTYDAEPTTVIVAVE
jgi:hypothetical protein